MRYEVAERDERKPPWLRDALVRIKQQSTLVAKLTPGTDAHKRATGVLLILQDSLHVMSEAAAVIEDIRRKRASEKPPVEDD